MDEVGPAGSAARGSQVGFDVRLSDMVQIVHGRAEKGGENGRADPTVLMRGSSRCQQPQRWAPALTLAGGIVLARIAVPTGARAVRPETVAGRTTSPCGNGRCVEHQADGPGVSRAVSAPRTGR